MALNLKTETVFTDDTATAHPPLPPSEIAPHFPQLKLLNVSAAAAWAWFTKPGRKA